MYMYFMYIYVQISYVSGGFGDPKNPSRVFTEQDWASTEEKDMDPYVKSKTLAEKAAWDFVSELPGNMPGKTSIMIDLIYWIFCFLSNLN